MVIKIPRVCSAAWALAMSLDGVDFNLGNFGPGLEYNGMLMVVRLTAFESLVLIYYS